MTTAIINIKGIDEPARFVSNALQVEGDIILKKGKFVVDGKSLLGVLAIADGSGGNITVEYPNDAPETFDNFLDTIRG